MSHFFLPLPSPSVGRTKPRWSVVSGLLLKSVQYATGTASIASLVDWSATVIAVAAGVVNVTIHVALCAAPKISGVHASDVNWPEGISVTVESTDDSLVEAFTVAV